VKAVVLFSCLTLTACSPAEPSPGPAANTTLQVSADGTSLELLNLSDRPAFFFIYERERAALINWAPCADASRCQFVPPRGRARVLYPEIGAYTTDSQEAIVWWWGSRGGSVPGETHAVVVRLRPAN
jgi:hypothetical protein